MCTLGHPLYNRLNVLDKKAFEKLTTRDFFRHYMAIEADFIYLDNVKYPGIPLNVDDTTTIYPKTGKKAFMTGFEYLEAKNRGCTFDKITAVLIPYETTSEAGQGLKSVNENFENSLKDVNVQSIREYSNRAPFMEIEKRIQAKRGEYKKGTFGNLFEKLLGNAGFGLISEGLGGKRKFDIKTKGMVVMTGGASLATPY